MRLTNGYQVSQAIHVAATLGLADLLGDGTRSSDELAEATGADADALYRLLRALASVGVLNEHDDRRFALTPLGEYLRSDTVGSLQDWAAFVGRPYHWDAWGSLLHSVRTGENAFRHLHGTGVWDFRQAHPEENAIFDQAMTSLTSGATEALTAAYDFGRFRTIVDVGGGRGALLIALLQKHPQLHGVLFDHPTVVAGAREAVHDAGVADRCRLVGGDFFDSVPAGGDAYVLKSVIHDWEDDESIRILRSCRAAMRDGSMLLLVELELGPPNTAPVAKFGDLNMLVAPGGRERTSEEYAALFAAGGFRLVEATPTGTGLAVFEGVPV